MIDPLLERLDAARQHLRRIRLLTGGLLVLATLMTALLGWFVCDYLFVHRIFEGGLWDTLLRALLLGGALVVAGRVAWVTVVAEWRIDRDDDVIAGRVERTHRALGGRLISSVQLARVDGQAAMATDLIAALIEQTVAEAEAFDFRAIVDPTELKRAALWLLAPLMLVGGLAAWKPAYAVVAAKRLGLQTVEYPTATRILSFTPTGPSVTQAQGEPLNLVVELDPQGHLPDDAEVVVRPANGRDATVRLKRSDEHPSRYLGVLPQVLTDCQVRAYAFDARWPTWVTVQAKRRPQVQAITAVMTVPAYLGAAPIEAPFSDLAAPVGSVVKLQIVSAEPVTRVDIELITGTADPVIVPAQLEAAGTTAAIELPVTQTTTVRVLLTDSHQLTNPDPVRTTITAVPDLPPVVALTFPQRDVAATRFARWPLRFSAKDDHGLDEVAIRWQPEDATGEPQTIPLGKLDGALQTAREEKLELSRFNASPGTRIAIWIEVSDRKPQVGASLKRTITILDPEQLRQELEAARTAAIEALSTARDRQTEIKQGVEKLVTSPASGTTP